MCGTEDNPTSGEGTPLQEELWTLFRRTDFCSQQDSLKECSQVANYQKIL